MDIKHVAVLSYRNVRLFQAYYILIRNFVTDEIVIFTSSKELMFFYENHAMRMHAQRAHILLLTPWNSALWASSKFNDQLASRQARAWTGKNYLECTEDTQKGKVTSNKIYLFRWNENITDMIKFWRNVNFYCVFIYGLHNIMSLNNSVSHIIRYTYTIFFMII